ncbi:MAG: helix-turn-helix domain-containing protein [Clostridium sp.]
MDIINEILEIENENQEKLFDERKLVGDKLLSIIKDKGYTKSSFSKITDISRPTLDKIIKGDIDNKTTFISHIKKIVEAKIASYEEFLSYESLNNNSNLVMMYSDNAPNGYRRTDDTKELFMILDDLINLSEIYK